MARRLPEPSYTAIIMPWLEETFVHMSAMQHLKEPIADLVDNILVAIMRHSIHQDTPACRVKHKGPIIAGFPAVQAVCLYGCPGIPIEILWFMWRHDLIQSVEIPDTADADKLSLVSVDCWKNQHQHLSTKIFMKCDMTQTCPDQLVPFQILHGEMPVTVNSAAYQEAAQGTVMVTHGYWMETGD